MTMTTTTTMTNKTNLGFITLVVSSWITLLVIVACNVAAAETETIAHNNLRRHDDVMPMQKPREPRIINGKDVDRLRYPYFSLMYGRSLCGAVLIGPRLVLSAAHCESAADKFRIGAFEAVDGGQAITIKSTFVHPDYTASQFDNDIMLFQLENDADFPFIQLEKETISGGEFTVIGFGDMDKGPSLELSDELQEVELQYVDNDTCDHGHGGRNEVKEDMLCAAGDNKDSCIGDSGGPLIKKGANVDEDTLVGLVSWGRGCAEEGVPGVYARISYFYDWIVETACDNFPDDAPMYMRCNPIFDFGSVFTFTSNPSAAPTRRAIIEERALTTDAPTTSPTTSIPTVSPIPTVSTMPSAAPVKSTEVPTNLKKNLQFVAWSPYALLRECQGDCDTDSECEGDFICFKRNGEFDTNEVPGCVPSREEMLLSNVDVCVNPLLT